MSPRVILVEDSHMLVQCLKLLLAPATVVVANDMATAEGLVQLAGPDDTVMVDLKLPDSSPLQTLCRIATWKTRRFAPRVVVITGTNDQRIIEAANNSPADAVALKSGGEGFFEQPAEVGLIRHEHENCACSENVERIEKEVREIVTSGIVHA